MENQQIQICKNEIEYRLSWGSSELWTNQDFELLVEEIFNKTKANLSLTTLKRIWGKVDYQSNPSIATLNVLAQYLDYANWRDFRKNHKVDSNEALNNDSTRVVKPISRYFNQKAFVALIVLIYDFCTWSYNTL
jgi:hypothetical protein